MPESVDKLNIYTELGNGNSQVVKANFSKSTDDDKTSGASGEKDADQEEVNLSASQTFGSFDGIDNDFAFPGDLSRF